MTKTEALYKFFSSFGLKAFPSSAVPAKEKLPYLTYDAPIGSWGDMSTSCTVKLWYHTASESVPNNKADEIGKAIGIGGVVLKCDDGVIWVKKGSPWCVSLTDPADTSTKMRQLNLEIDYNTL